VRAMACCPMSRRHLCAFASPFVIPPLSPAAFPAACPHVTPGGPTLAHPTGRVQPQGSCAAPLQSLLRCALATPREARVHTPGEGCLLTGGTGGLPGVRCRGTGAQSAFKLPSMLPLLSSPLAYFFLPCILWALGSIAPLGLAASCGAQTAHLQRPATRAGLDTVNSG
jgi:hypothetical protein